MMVLLASRWTLLMMVVTMLQDASTQQKTDSCNPPCTNGFQCVPTQTGSTCMCPQGFTGALCETQIDDCTFPATNGCRNNARCVDGLNNYTCECLSGWEGTFCEEDVDECSQVPGPCQNGASCMNTPGSFACSCAPGYTGTVCETDINECDSAPCRFNGTCVNLVNNFRCECRPGYLGTGCEAVVRQCELSIPCENNGICMDIPTGGYKCYCKFGYYGDHCASLIDTCSSSPCKNGATCLNTGVNYTCSCAPGFTGRNCETYIKDCSGTPCWNNGTCSETPPAGLTCQCLGGFTGSRCETNINECASNPCKGKQSCVDLVLGYRCVCPPDTTGELCETTISDCRATTCLNNGTCLNDGTGYVCVCPSPYTDPVCSTSLDPCTPNPCLYNGRCNRTSETDYSCDCSDGFIGERCEAEIYDCWSNPCLNGGTCDEILNSGDETTSGNSGTGGNQRQKYSCLCPASFTGALCETDLLACLSSPCRNGASCTSINQTDYSCKCADSWTGTQCDQDVNECLSGSPVCQNGGQCINKTPGFSCACLVGWTGSHCEVQVLSCANLKCLNGGTCFENPGNSTYCVCPADFTGSDCSVDLNPCSQSPCYNNATCQRVNDSVGSGDGQNFTCHCLPGYTGVLCDGNIDECATPNPCLNNATCIDAVNGYTCQCLAGWTGLMCGDNIDECLSKPCLNGGNCTDLVNGFSCKCDLGYTGVFCDGNIDECATLNPCLNNATCIDAVNGYNCQCLAGWTGLMCGDNIDECLSKPCLNGGNCTDLVNGFSCKCDLGYAGHNCSIDVNECSYSPCLNNATCKDVVSGFVCICPPGYTGVACSIDIDECASSPCKGSATCEDGINTFTCHCPPGYQGQLCEVDIPECSPNPCKYGGTCIEPNPASFSCQCPAGVEGATCERVRSANFDGQKSLTLPSLVQLASRSGGQQLRRAKRAAADPAEILIQFNFTTTVLDGILLVSTGILSNGLPQHVVLELRNSILYVSSNNGYELLKGTIVLTTTSGGIYSHVVQIGIGNTSVDVRIDPESCVAVGGVCLAASLGFRNVTSWNLNGTVHFGGVDKFTPYLRSLVKGVGGFVGCLGTLTINSQPINLAESLEFSAPDNGSESSPTFGCAVHTSCPNGTCMNGGTCRDTWVNSSCDCAPGFSGQNCSFQDMANFEINSMLHFTGATSAITELRFSFSAATATGLIMYTVTMDSLSLSLDNGQLILHLLLSNGSNVTSRLGSNLHLQDWVKVSLQFETNKFTVQVSSNTTGSLGSSNGTTDGVIIAAGDIFWGTLLENALTDKWKRGLLLSNQSIKGCIRDININKVPLDLSTSSPFSGSDPPKAKPGCEKEDACLAVVCQNNGVCVPNWKGPTCKCQEGYAGGNCSQETATTFDGTTSYSVINLDRNMFPFGDEGRIEFRTRQADSTLMVLQFFSISGTVDKFIEFRIVAGLVQVFSSFTNASGEFKISVPDGQWHILDWTRVGTSFDLNLDSSGQSLQTGFESSQSNLNNSMQVFVGARPNFTGSNTQLAGFFKGCLNGLSFNNASLPYLSTETNRDGLLVNSVGIVTGCHSDAVCGINTCAANSYCIDEWNSFVCNCLDGWEGTNCSKSVDDCRNDSCKNGGTCLDNHLSFTCICAPRYTGNLCETIVEVCPESNTCNLKNTESCAVLLNSSEYKCNCRPGFTGKSCENIINNCADVLCFNNATCQNGGNTSTCTCQDGFESFICAATNYYCYRKLCNNDEDCGLKPNLNSSNGKSNSTANLELSGHNVFQCENNSTNTSSTCKCVNNCFNNNCENNDSCGNSNTSSCSQCVNNNCANSSSCSYNSSTLSSNSTSNYTTICVCKDGFTGQYCETEISICDSSPCLNNGTCVVVSNVNSSTSPRGSFNCNCVAGFSGHLCESDVDECKTNPCQNGGTCTNLVGNFSCSCVQGFSGPSCEVDLQGCSLNPCQNSGQCSGAAGNYSCLCDSKFTGKHCETALAQAAQSASLSDGALAAIILVCILILILIIILIIWLVLRRRKTRGRYKPAQVEGQLRNGDLHMNSLARRGERMI